MEKSIGRVDAKTSACVSIFLKHDTNARPFVTDHATGPGVPLDGCVVFVAAQIVFMQLVGGGFFSRGDPELIAGSLLGHLVYGAVVGWSYGGERESGRLHPLSRLPRQ